jgi:hypothetical protein
MAGQLTIDTLKASSGVLGTQNGMTGIAKAWVNFNGTGTVAIRSSFNVSSVTDNGTGDYTVNFTTALPDANYSLVGTCQRDQVTGNAGNGFESVVVVPKGLTTPFTTSGARIRTIALDRTYDDATIICVSIFR